MSQGSQILGQSLWMFFTWIGLTCIFTVFSHSVWFPHPDKRKNFTKQQSDSSAPLENQTIVYNSYTFWYTQLLLPQSSNLLMQPHNSVLHPLWKQLCLLACRVSGKLYPRMTFQGKIETSHYLTLLVSGNTKAIQALLRRCIELDEQQADPYNSSVTIVLDFFVQLHGQDTTLNTARSVVSAITSSMDRTPIGSHLMVHIKLHERHL